MDFMYAPTEQPHWRNSRVKTSYLMERIFDFLEMYKRLSPEIKMWAKTVYYEQELGKYLYVINKRDNEGFETYNETREAIGRARVMERFVNVPQEDPRMESLRCLYKAFMFMRNAHELSIEKLKEAHSLLLGPARKEIAGQIRVEDGPGSLVLAAAEVPDRLELLYDSVNDKLWSIQEARFMGRFQIQCTIKLAACFLQLFEYIQPFTCGNSKCARLVVAGMFREIMPFPSLIFDEKIVDCLGIELDADGKPKFGPPRELAALLVENVYVGWQRFWDQVIVENKLNSRRTQDSFILSVVGCTTV